MIAIGYLHWYVFLILHLVRYFICFLASFLSVCLFFICLFVCLLVDLGVPRAPLFQSALHFLIPLLHLNYFHLGQQSPDIPPNSYLADLTLGVTPCRVRTRLC